MTAAHGRAQRVTLSVPGLHDPPLLSGCCAVSRDDLLLEELDSWSELLLLEIDPNAATAVVLVPSGSDDLAGALEALADRGLAASVVTTESTQTPTTLTPDRTSLRTTKLDRDDAAAPWLAQRGEAVAVHGGYQLAQPLSHALSDGDRLTSCC